MRLSYRAILYDLDGTLVDNFTAIHRTAEVVAGELGLKSPDYDSVRSAVGGAIPLTMERLFGSDLATEAAQRFRLRFPDYVTEGLCWMPGAEAFLDEAAAAGFRQAVLTNKDGSVARAIFDHLRAAERFEFILGAKDTPYRKPDPAFTAEALSRLGLEASSVCLIGDSPFDFEAAAVAGLDCYLLSTGTHGESELRELRSTGLYSSLDQLSGFFFATGESPQGGGDSI